MPDSARRRVLPLERDALSAGPVVDLAGLEHTGQRLPPVPRRTRAIARTVQAALLESPSSPLISLQDFLWLQIDCRYATDRRVTRKDTRHACGSSPSSTRCTRSAASIGMESAVPRARLAGHPGMASGLRSPVPSVKECSGPAKEIDRIRDHLFVPGSQDPIRRYPAQGFLGTQHALAPLKRTDFLQRVLPEQRVHTVEARTPLRQPPLARDGSEQPVAEESQARIGGRPSTGRIAPFGVCRTDPNRRASA
jgi:hypothetical protein